MGFISNFVLSCWIYAIAISFAFGVKIEFYRNHNYTGLIYESSSTEKCNNFPVNEPVYSIKSDACLITYLHPDCKSPRTWKTMPGNNSAAIGYYLATKSFHVCNDEEGGSELNIDITKYYEDDKPAMLPAVLERYRRVCTCINIPDYIQKMDKWSINNHANEFRAYYEPNCLEHKVYSFLIQEGQYDVTRNIYNWTVTTSITKNQYKVLSIGPNKNSSYFNSSCQHYNMLSQLKSNVSILEQKLRQTYLKVSTSQKDFKDIQQARVNETGKVEEEFRTLKLKLDDVEKDMEDKIEKLKDELEFLFDRKNK